MSNAEAPTKRSEATAIRYYQKFPPNLEENKDLTKHRIYVIDLCRQLHDLKLLSKAGKDSFKYKINRNAVFLFKKTSNKNNK